MSEKKRKYQEITLKEKGDALKLLQKGSSMRDIAKTFGVSVTTVSNWAKNKDTIEERQNLNEVGNSKRLSRLTGPNETLDERVFLFGR